MSLLESPSWILSAVFVVGSSILLCVAVLLLVRRWIPVHDLKAHHDVAGFTLGIIGVLYSVILGFTVVNVQGKSNQVAQTVHTEAICLADLYRQAAIFDPAGRAAVRASLRAYVQYVIQKEWGRAKSRTIDLGTQEIMAQIWNSYYTIDLSDEKIKIWYQQAASKLDDFLNARIARQFSSWERLGAMMWTILISGALITVCFMYFFGLERLRTHIIMTALVAG
ncbi:MAG: DUF4239 domain-containing protein, partial [Verrucomicrobiota bacterium]|nr:DUF4239 domain-containing protein [Verrucomicrobiota bacterium]